MHELVCDSPRAFQATLVRSYGYQDFLFATMASHPLSSSVAHAHGEDSVRL